MIKDIFSLNLEAISFLEKTFKQIEELGINLEENFLDHICYRVKSLEEYGEMKKIFSTTGELLIESEVGGRNITTYKLTDGIVFKERIIKLIELPAPKEGNHYESGFEHCEFVINESFKEFEELYSDLKFDWKGATKSFNPELRLSLLEGLSIKFHHMSLEKVIEIEKGLSS